MKEIGNRASAKSQKALTAASKVSRCWFSNLQGTITSMSICDLGEDGRIVTISRDRVVPELLGRLTLTDSVAYGRHCNDGGLSDDEVQEPTTVLRSGLAEHSQQGDAD